MRLEIVVMSVVVGLMVGWAAGIVRKAGGYGRARDVLLGVGGSVAASWILHGLGVVSQAQRLAPLVIAVGGAAIVLVAQRTIWPAHS